MLQEKLIKNTSISTASAAIASFLSALQAVIVARLLGPESYGELHIYRLIISYAVFANLGTLWAMVRQVSFYRGKGLNENIASIYGNTFTFNLISASIVCSIIFIFYPIVYNKPSNKYFELITVLFIIVAQSIFFFIREYLVSIKDFVTRGILIIVFSATNIVFVILLGISFGIRGVLTSTLLAYCLGIILGLKKKKNILHFSLSKRNIRELLETGIPIFGNGLLSQLIMSIDRIMIMLFLPIIELGYFGIAVTIKTFMDTLYRSIFMTIFPQLTEKYGNTNNTASLKNYIWTPLFVSTHISPLFFGSTIIMIPLLIHYALPKYIPAVSAIQFIVASSFFACIQAGIINFFIAINKIHTIYSLRIAGILLSVILMFFSIQMKLGIYGIAFCTTIVSAVVAGLLVNSFLINLNFSLLNRIKHTIRLFYPFFYMCLGLLLANYFFPITVPQPTNMFFKKIESLILFAIWNIPLFLYVHHKTDIFRKILATSNHSQ